ncbi:TonB-dependent receptor [Chitinophagaceae bacterium IBVUCB2]|nr:TonB-dependent receptor [Chitinophagaceae bacterium IBVUCB2]
MKIIAVPLLFISFFSSGQPLFADIKLREPFLGRSIELKISLSGTITDAKTGEPLVGASVYLTDDKIGAIANEKGKYVLTNIPDGHHVIEISHAGYATIVEHLELITDTEKDFKLSAEVVENRGVIITGVSGATSIRKTPVPVTSIRKTALLQSSSTNIIDALTQVPGVSQLSTGPAISKPFIRGLGYNRVVIVNEGVRQEGQQWGDEHGVEIDELSVGRVEVLKGPASLIYGSDALAGVINFITNTPVAEGTFKGNILSNYQSNNGLFALNANLAANNNGFNWNVYGTYKSAGDYKNKYDGKVLNSRFNERNFGGYVGINKSWGYSHFIFSCFDQRLGLVEGDRDDATGQFILFAGNPLERIATNTDLDSRHLFVPQQRVQHNKFILDNNFAINKSRLKINLGYQNSQRQEFGNPEDPAEKELFFDLRTVNYAVQWQLPELKEWHTTIGVNGMGQKNLNKGQEALIPEYNLFDIGIFIYAQRLFNKATLTGGFRFDNRSIDSKEFFEGADLKFEKFNRSFSNFSGSVGVSYEPSDIVTIKANIARGFRAPTLAELASNGAHEGSNRYEYGDQKLRSETSLQFDAGFDVDYEHFSIGVSAFYNNISDFIFYRKLESAFGGDSIVNVDGEDITAFRFNQLDATLRGVEASIDLHPHPLDWLHFENTMSFVRGTFNQNIDGSDNLPLIPAARLTSELRATFNEGGKSFRNIYIKASTDKTFKQNKAFTGFDTETATSGYTLLNAGFGADITNSKMKTLFSLHFSITNITNVAYQNHLSRLKYAAENMNTGRLGVFNTGRNFSVKANIPLDFSNK